VVIEVKKDNPIEINPKVKNDITVSGKVLKNFNVKLTSRNPMRTLSLKMTSTTVKFIKTQSQLDMNLRFKKN
jgi:hypothetical protein